MGDNRLKFYALLVAAGLLLLAYSASHPGYALVSELSSGLLGQRVAVEGQIASKYAHDGDVFMSIGTDRSEVSVVLFKTAIHDRLPYLLLRGETVRVFGEVSLHAGALQVVADSVEAPI